MISPSACLPRSATDQLGPPVSPRPAASYTTSWGTTREQEAGASVADLCRRHGMSSATFYGWKAKYGGMDVSDAKRLRALEDENAKLKRLYADAMPDNAGLKGLVTKKW